MTHLSNDDITAQLKAVNTTLKIAGLERIVSRNNIMITVVVVTTEGRHTRVNCQSDNVCRLCAGIRY